MNFYQATEVGNTRYGPDNFCAIPTEAWVVEFDDADREVARRDITSYRVVGLPSPRAQLPSTYF